MIHNIAIFRGSNAEGANVFRGQVFRGPRVVEEQVPALKAGDYFLPLRRPPDGDAGQLVVE